MAFQNDIYSTAISNGIPNNLALLIVAQAKHETAGFTSNVFLNCNNAFGYKSVGNPCLASPNYQSYNNVAESTIELINWIKRRQNEGRFPQNLNTITDAWQYATLLKNSGYFGDTASNYANGIMSWYSDNVGTTGTEIAFISISALIFLFFLSKNKKS